MARKIAQLAAGIISGAILFPMTVFAASAVLDAPHNESNNISCGSCHGTVMLSSAFWLADYVAEDIDKSPLNMLCKSCHTKEFGPFTDSEAPKENTHSSLTTDNGYGNWTRQCTECHNPHSQEQKLWKATDGDKLYLATGKIVNYTYDSDTDSSFLEYDPAYVDPANPQSTPGITYKSGWNAARLLAKTNSYSKAILFPNRNDAQSRYSYVVTAISDDPQDPTITVKGNVKKVWTYLQKNPLTQTQFGIIYGQYIKQTINGKPVKFFDQGVAIGQAPDTTSGNSFADGDATFNGVCEVCHTQTTHYRQDNGGLTHNDINDNPVATAGTNCVKCHRHENGFAHKSDGTGQECGGCHSSNKHPEHLSLGVKCSGCHNLANMRDGNGNIINPSTTAVCETCHHNGRGGLPNDQGYRANWNNPAYHISCDGCHNGRPGLDPLVMATDGHNRLVGLSGIRQYPCWYCHSGSIRNYIDVAGQRWNNWTMTDSHVNGTADVKVASEWAVPGEQAPKYITETKVCMNTYCHTDGTSPNPEMRAYAWNGGSETCNSCHGHNPSIQNCGDCHTDNRQFAPEDNWLTAMPMYANSGPGTSRANSHFRHLFTGFSCDDCHANTVVGACLSCHENGVPEGGMGDTAHVNGAYHVNRTKDVVFKNGGSYSRVNKSCSGTICHVGAEPQWGGSVTGDATCLECHGTSDPDVDDFGEFNEVRAKINLTEWVTAGHGRPTLDANGNPNPYPQSNNPAANFPANGCWYCHDNSVLHKTETNPFRLRQHAHFNLRFERECAYCHMLGETAECMNCHNDTESLTQKWQLSNIEAGTQTNPPYLIPRPDHTLYGTNGTTCNTAPNCHVSTETRHNVEVPAGIQNATDIADIKNQYVMMGVCLKCHDDDSGGQCQTCHQGAQYKTGFDPGLQDMGFIQPDMAKASSFHFGYKHYQDYTTLGVWKGGKFCWDCHDPHGDANSFSTSQDDKYNIYMVQTMIATETDGTYGKPVQAERRAVKFIRNQSGMDYARSEAPYNGVCNVCHTPGLGHFSNNGGDAHNAGRRCTNCHEHRFTDSHASDQDCDTCHDQKPVPRHTAFGLPRDCVKCHDGTVKKRMNIMGQFRANSHHVQRADNKVTNKDCYQCHWEATENGLIDLTYHTGYNYQTHATVPDDRVDLVVWGPGVRPSTYDIDGTLTGTVTAATFRPSQLNLTGDAALVLQAERREVEKITPHCLSCHSEQNNSTDIFGDCKTPSQYSWDGYSIAAKFSDLGTTKWGKYTGTANAAKKDIVKAYSGHGNAMNNGGGYNVTTGIDATITNTRAGGYNVQCFDCHSSHGSYVAGTSSSYVTFNGTNNGANLKETQGGKGGYPFTYKASAIPDPNSVNPFNVGAGQCFDCHESATADATNEWGSKPPWGYLSTFGASQPVIGYRDNKRFKGSYNGRTTSGAYANNPSYPTQSDVSMAYRTNNKQTVGGHMKASHKNPASANYNPSYTIPAKTQINGLCTPCHDPHGISPTLGSNKKYGVPLLKGTYLTSPYKEDHPPANVYGTIANATSKTWGNRSTNSMPAAAAMPEYRFHIDRITFSDLIFNNTFIAETEQQFAGLCLGCHAKNTLTNESYNDQNFRTVDRIHEAVKGWGGYANEHQFPCSKCHEPHASGLPRLMQTNCLNYNHRGGAASGGVPMYTQYSRQRGFPIANIYGASYSSYNWSTQCHAKVTPAQNPGQADWKTKQLWNNVTLW